MTITGALPATLTVEDLLPYISRSVLGTVAVLLLFGLFRILKRDYLRDWIAASLAFIVAAVADGVSAVYSSTPVAGPLAASVATVTAFAFSLWLFLGYYRLVNRRPLHVRLERRITVFLAFLAAAILLLPVRLGELLPDTTTRALRITTVSVFLLCSAFVLLKARKRHTSFGVLGVILLIVAVDRVWHMVYIVGGLGEPPFHRIPDIVLEAQVLIGGIVAIFADTRQEADLASSQIETLAYYDSLTGLPNRALFYDRLILALAQAERYSHRVAVLFFDLDGFKSVNDLLGHTVGDGLLKAVAGSMRESLRLGDTLARFGGDEFILLLPRLGSLDEAEKVAHKILEAVRQPFQVGGREILTTTSIGIAVYPDDASDSGTLVMNADTAMYRAKEKGRDRCVFYAPTLSGPVFARAELESQLSDALRSGQLEVHYQPIVTLRTGKVAGVEALVRWSHPVFGQLLPAQFLAIAEVSGLIVPIGREVVRTAAADAAEWLSAGNDYFLAVNFSGRELLQTDLAPHLTAMAKAAGVDPRRIHLEVSEKDAIQNRSRVSDLLPELKAEGFRISIDNYGADTSSLVLLHQLTADVLKIDSSIISELNDTSSRLICAIVALAKTLHLRVVAEGVERQEQVDFLTQCGCEMAQGYFFAPPQTRDRVARFFETTEAAMGGEPEIVTA